MRFQIPVASALSLLALGTLTAAASGDSTPQDAGRQKEKMQACAPASSSRADGVTQVPDQPPQTPRTEVREPYPNPARDQATTIYSLSKRVAVRIDLFDAAGRHVRTLIDQIESAGAHEAAWDGTGDNGAAVTPGIYFARLRLGSEVATRKLVVIR